MVRRRAELLEFAVLGLLHDGPRHGYELRKELNSALGVFRALSYGTLYPCLRSLEETGWIIPTADSTLPKPGTRARISYELTAAGKEHFQELARLADTAAYDDDGFDVRFAFFARTEAEVRLRILEGRRSRIEERLESIRETSRRNRERMDAYTAALQQYGEDGLEREVRWLTELISVERDGAVHGRASRSTTSEAVPPRTTPGAGNPVGPSNPHEE